MRFIKIPKPTPSLSQCDASCLGARQGMPDGGGRSEVAGSRCPPLLTNWRAFLSSKLGRDSMHQIKVPHVACLYMNGEIRPLMLGTDVPGPVESEK